MSNIHILKNGSVTIRTEHVIKLLKDMPRDERYMLCAYICASFESYTGEQIHAHDLCEVIEVML